MAGRFWSHVSQGRPDECWPWNGAIRRGYGSFKVPAGALGVQKRSDLYSHRVAYYLSNGAWPEPVARHTCDNPPCCNPAHIVAGTWKQNMQDKYQRGRAVHRTGEAAHRAKISAEDVSRIRDLCSGGLSQTKTAKRFGISQTEVGRIVRGERWAH